MSNFKESWIIALTSFFVVLILVGGFWFLAHNKEEPSGDKGPKKMEQSFKKNQEVREPAVAGQFYPAQAEELAGQVDSFLAQAPAKDGSVAVLGLILPHAGYEYSGQVAAYGFKYLENEDIETVILIGNSHHAYFEGAAVYSEGYFKTPLGEVEIDAALAREIIGQSQKIKANASVHRQEHSLEVEIPFLQRALKNFKLVPILLGNSGLEEVEVLAKAISQNIAGRKILVIASSDMSHYPDWQQANDADKKTIGAILTGRVEKLESVIERMEKENLPNQQTFLCGRQAVEVLMLVMQDWGVKDIKLLKYANSGDVTGDKGRVVGYSAIAFYDEPRGSKELTKVEQRRLLDIARQSVESYTKTGRTSVFSESAPSLTQPLGAFVTIKKHGQLRGCIGNFTGSVDGPLWQNVIKMAIAAATQDARFTPVGKDELPFLEYEVSVLSPMKKIDDWREIQLGKHGVEIKKGGRSGVFLPQVAEETGWNLETFMGQLCSQKAGLSWTCWQEKDTELYVFTAQVFEEKQ